MGYAARPETHPYSGVVAVNVLIRTPIGKAKFFLSFFFSFSRKVKLLEEKNVEEKLTYRSLGISKSLLYQLVIGID